MLPLLTAEYYYKSKMAVGHALAYRLTGEARLAARARELILADLMDGQWYLRRRAHGPAHVIVESILAYDRGGPRTRSEHGPITHRAA